MPISRPASAALAVVAWMALAGPVGAQAPYTVVMSGLDNPRGLAFAPNGALYVAEAGRGGRGPCLTSPFGEERCFGAGGNALLWAAANGKVETAAVFGAQPNPTPVGPPLIEAVPTAVARGPDGALYVTQLTGFPFVQGLASIFRVLPDQAPTIHCSGFKALMDLAFAADGSLYVVENATGGLFLAPGTGQLSRVAPDCSRSTVLVGLDRPTSVAVGPDGAVYVTNHGVTAGIGEVLRVGP